MSLDYKLKPVLKTIKDIENIDIEKYLVEPKYKGTRIIIDSTDGRARLFTPDGEDYTDKFSELVQRFNSDNIVLDGQLFWKDANGDHVSRPITEDRKKLLVEDRLIPCIVLFDILIYNGEDIRDKELKSRKLKLSFFKKHKSGSFVIDCSNAASTQHQDFIQNKNFEGALLKRKDSKYNLKDDESNWIEILD